MKLPLKLYDIDNRELGWDITIPSNTIYLQGFQRFNIRIRDIIFPSNISQNTVNQSILFSVTPDANNTNLLIDKATGFYGYENTSYTLYVATDNTKIVLEMQSKSNPEEIYEMIITSRFDNIIDSNKGNEHYQDILTNKNLPSFKELEPAIINDNYKKELVKRLLLDFKHVLSRRGTKQGVLNFFSLLGFDSESLSLLEEYLKPEKDGSYGPVRINGELNINKLTTNPDKETDIKTGNYHLLYSNYINNGYDKHNLPLNEIQTDDLSELFEQLKHAIPLANKYFTLAEQEIVFFGITYSTNFAKHISATSTYNRIHFQDVCHVDNNLKIQLYSRNDNQHLVVNSIQKLNELMRTEVKFIKFDERDLFRSLFIVDTEIDDEEFEDIDVTDIAHLFSMFGTLCHLVVDSPETYVSIHIQSLENTNDEIIVPKTWIDTEIVIPYFASNSHRFKVEVVVFDQHNNREKYDYIYSVNEDSSRIDFSLYNSSEMLRLNDITIEVDSSMYVSKAGNIHEDKEYILPGVAVPDDLSEYYNVDASPYNMKWLSKNNQYMLDPINPYRAINELSETIPLELVGNNLHIISFRYRPGLKLVLKLQNMETNEFEFHPYYDIPQKLLRNIFVTVLDIYDQDLAESVPYVIMFPTTTEIIFEKDTYDWYLEKDGGYISLYELWNPIYEFQETKIPINYDIPLFFRDSNLVPTFQHYCEGNYNMTIVGEEGPKDFVAIKSLFTRLINVETDPVNNRDNFYLAIGDVILATINTKYITRASDVEWTIYNSFTKEILHQSKTYSLRYRINEKTCYDINLRISIDGKEFIIFKQVAFSSFKINMEE